MDLLKAREKAKKQQLPKENKKKEHTTLSEGALPVPLEVLIKKDVTKIEKIEPQETAPTLLPEPEIVIAPAKPSMPSPIKTEVKEILEKIFKDMPAETKEARVMKSPAAPLAEFQLLIFRIGNELYGINLEMISEIIRHRNAALIPNTPHYVHGLITLRGHMVPIVNSHLRLNLSPLKTSSKRRIIIVEYNNEFMGLTVDEAFNVITINKNLIKAPPPTLTDIELELINGVYHHKDKLVILLNTDNFFKFL